MRLPTLIVLYTVFLLLLACNSNELEEDKQLSFEAPEGAAKRLSDTEFNQLSPLNQYRVANKLAATFFHGVNANDFFDLSEGTSELSVAEGRNYISHTAARLKQRLTGKEKDNYSSRVDSRFDFTESDHKDSAIPLAVIYTYPESRDLFEAWMAYRLTNTILFSPAVEIDSASYSDAQVIYSNLVKAMSKGLTIREITLAHMKSEANWRRFRSPEDNTREMIEIYLGLFDRDDDVPKASIACKNWYLTTADDDNERYALRQDPLNENNEEQFVLGAVITSCEDFYAVVANHPLVIPRITTVLVDHLMPEASSNTRAAMIKSIVATKPTQFFEVFSAIIFSRQYLLDNEKPKSLEEAFFNVADRIYWEPHSRFFNDLTNPDSGARFPTLHKMKQPSMTLKLGRFAAQPLDSLSFAYFHEAMRDQLLIRRKTDSFSNSSSGWSAELIKTGDLLDDNEYIDYLFITVLSRKAIEEEHTQLTRFFEEKDITADRINQTLVIFDYLTRLPELYYFQAL